MMNLMKIMSLIVGLITTSKSFENKTKIKGSKPEKNNTLTKNLLFHLICYGQKNV